jgi:hypothetical protein
MLEAEGVGLGKMVPRLNRKVQPTTRCRPVSALDALPAELRPSGRPGTSQVAAPCDVRLCDSSSMFIGARFRAARTTSWAACALDEVRAWDKPSPAHRDNLCAGIETRS